MHTWECEVSKDCERFCVVCRIEELVREVLRLQDRAAGAEKRLLSATAGTGSLSDPLPQVNDVYEDPAQDQANEAV